jgi:hypothetical protein
MVRIRRLGIVRTSNSAAMVYLLLTLVILLIAWAFSNAIGPSSFNDPTTGQTIRFDFPIVLVLVLPLVYAVIGWLFTALFCVFYNLAAGIAGGIELDLVDERPVAPPAASYVPPSAEPPASYPG